MKRDVKLTIDEGDVIVQVALDAMQRLGSPPPWKNILTIARLWSAYSSAAKLPALLPFRRRISRDDLAFLAHHIDEWLAGKVPPRNLPSEYRDWRPDTLRSFKDRMVRESLWPRALSNESG
jgi:hypothetical protein